MTEFLDADSTTTNLRNRFLVMRHGHSLANQQAMIISSPEVGIAQFGLTETGVAEVQKSIVMNLEGLESVDKIYASDFLRTRQTAEIVSSHLHVDIEFDKRLRERDFGQFDGQSNKNYQVVWHTDSTDPSGTDNDIESVAGVAARLLDFVTEVDGQTVGKDILVVSHGDPLQILLTAVAGRPVSSHRKLAPLQTAEIRLLRSTKV